MAKEHTDEEKGYIVALLEERRGYQVFGDKAGVAAVDAELKRIGYSAVKPSKKAETR